MGSLVRWPTSLKRINGGFTLSEVMISVGLLAVAVLAVIGLFTGAIQMQAQSQERAEAEAVARDIMERIRAAPSNVPPAPATWIGGEFTSTPVDAGPPAFPPLPYPYDSGGYSVDVYLENASRPDMKLVRVVIRWKDSKRRLEVQTFIRN